MRNSSVELFRILASVLVLVVHFYGFFLGLPPEFGGFSEFYLSQDIIVSISVICVNCFLVITGWYGLSFKLKHIFTIYSILVWIYVPFFLINCYINNQFSFLGLLNCFIAFGVENYYVQCYMMLLVMSPILNSFIKKYGKCILPYTLIFWSIEIIFDWILDNNSLGFGGGFQLTHFILMYMLGRTAFLYRDQLKTILSNKTCVLICILGPTSIALMYLFLPYKYCFAYSNPLNILVSFSLFLLFERKSFHNAFINSIGRSTLAVYIFHMTDPVLNYLLNWDTYCLKNYSYGIYLLLMLATVCITFVVAVCYDKIKDLFMPQLGKKVCNWLEPKVNKIKPFNE